MTEQDIYARFNVWCTEMGVVAPKLEYPAYFNGARGIGVKQDIESGEVMCSVPYSVALTPTKARAIPELAKVFDDHPEIFTKDNYENSEVLIAFLLYEMSKGEKSIWHLRIKCYTECPRFWNWDQSIIDETQDPSLIRMCKSRAIKYKQQIQSLLAVFGSYPDLFDQSLVNEQTLLAVEPWVDCYHFNTSNTGEPLAIALIPFADMFNHAENDWFKQNWNKSEHLPELLAGKMALWEIPWIVENYVDDDPDSQDEEEIKDNHRYLEPAI
jgi:hypothetical protein